MGGPWQTLNITLWDYDSMSACDFIGTVTLPLAETPKTTLPLLDQDGNEVGEATITLSITRRSYERESRFKDAWRIHLLSAAKLPAMDRFPVKSDPYALVTALPCKGIVGAFEQRTCVQAGCLHPIWDEVFEVPTVIRPGMLDTALLEMCPDLTHEGLDFLTPTDDSCTYKLDLSSA